MKLISLNVEGLRHHDRIFPFLEMEYADIVCLQEASQVNVAHLESINYNVTFLPRCTKIQDGTTFIDGQIIATKLQHSAISHYYHNPKSELPFEEYDPETNRHTSRQGLTVCTLDTKDINFVIATTHFTWAPDGDTASEPQTEDIQKLLEYTNILPPHILCGDFNIARHINGLYAEICTAYTDNIPEKYKHSLDPTLHRLASVPEKKYLTTKYMVDYIFSQPPYKVENIRFEFGVSDHAAVIADIST